MTNLELIVALLERHRYARAWDDAAVGRDLLERFGIDPVGVAANPIPDPNAVTEDEVTAAELAAHDAAKVAAGKRAALRAQSSREQEGATDGAGAAKAAQTKVTTAKLPDPIPAPPIPPVILISENQSRA